jgi:hypothetical protein
MKFIVAFIVLSVGLVGATSSRAEADTKWSLVSNGCIVDSAYASKAVVSNNGTVTFASGAYGDLYMTCPVAVYASSCNQRLHITGKNVVFGESTLDGYLNGIPFGSGSAVTVIGSSLTTSSNAKGTSSSDTFMLDFENNYYYVGIIMHRGINASYQPIFYGVYVSDQCT